MLQLPNGAKSMQCVPFTVRLQSTVKNDFGFCANRALFPRHDPVLCPGCVRWTKQWRRGTGSHYRQRCDLKHFFIFYELKRNYKYILLICLVLSFPAFAKLQLKIAARTQLLEDFISNLLTLFAVWQRWHPHTMQAQLTATATYWHWYWHAVSQ